MKLQDTHTNGTGCCQEQVHTNQPDCCSGEQNMYQSCCCSGEENMHQPCCCSQQDTTPQEGCCKATHYEGAHHPSSNDCHKPMANADTGSLEHLQALLNEANDKYVRLYAEFDNFKKRAVKERMALTDKANEQTLKELLTIVDDFERCISALQGAQEGLQHIAGINLIYDKLGMVLKKYGVKEIVIEQGSAFNSDFHEAIMQQPVDNVNMQGKIVAVVEKGYLINDYVLRFAKVIIGV